MRADPGPGALDVAHRPLPVRLQPRRVPPPRPGRRGALRRAPGRAGRAPTSSSCPARSTSPPTWRGCASAGWPTSIERAAAAGVRVLGICGGCQMLGRAIDDPDGVEGGRPRSGGRAGPAAVRRPCSSGEKVTQPARRHVAHRPADAVGRAARRDGDRLRDPQRPHRRRSGVGGRQRAGDDRPRPARGPRRRRARSSVAARRPSSRRRSTSSPTPSTQHLDTVLLRRLVRLSRTVAATVRRRAGVRSGRG